MICIGEMITRNRYYTKRGPTRDAHKIFIVCEGMGTEPAYFSFFQNLSSNLELVIIPPETGTDPVSLTSLAQSKFFTDDSKYSIDYRAHDTVWFVIDTDQWEKEGKIERLRQYCSSLNSVDNITWKKYDEVKPYIVCNVAQSNPSFEIWLYYHVFPQKPTSGDIEKSASFKEFVNNAISGGFNPQKDQVNLKEAIANSRANYIEGVHGNPGIYCTEVHNLGDEIYPFVQRELERLKNKVL